MSSPGNSNVEPRTSLTVKVDQLKNLEALDGLLFRVIANCFIDICIKHREHVDIDDVVSFEEAAPENVHSQNEMLASGRSDIARLESSECR